MVILPAIDLRGGKCVRLKQGDYSQETIFGDDPVEIARKWVSLGTQILHLVDLDGAKQGHPVNADVVRRIVYTTRVPCQLGGGIRNDRDLETVFSWGVQRAVIGTRALQDPHWVRQVIERYPNRIVLGLDARGGKVATHGWLETSELNAIEVAMQFDDLPLAGIVFTDISKDGMLNGPNIEALREMARAVRTPVIASGGITTLGDVKNLLELDLAGAIIGRALYEGQLDLRDVLQTVQAHSQSGKDATP
jgi:phosphoribosylformimino-5-aminoimidazole carboxamide ribotide isomerase